MDAVVPLTLIEAADIAVVGGVTEGGVKVIALVVITLGEIEDVTLEDVAVG